MLDLIGWFTQMFDEEAIVVEGIPDLPIASLDNIRDTCGEDS